MRRHVWSTDEIRDLLLATQQAGGLPQVLCGSDDESSRAARAYSQGFRAALLSLALAFGLAPSWGSTAMALAEDAQGDSEATRGAR